jgi:hypothetical protein
VLANVIIHFGREEGSVLADIIHFLSPSNQY